MKHLTLVILLALAPLSWGETLSIHLCELGKPEENRFTGLEKCVEGDVLFYPQKMRKEWRKHLVQLCKWDSQSDADLLHSINPVGVITCIYRGYELPVRE